jgi:hypothetical protein
MKWIVLSMTIMQVTVGRSRKFPFDENDGSMEKPFENTISSWIKLLTNEYIFHLEENWDGYGMKKRCRYRATRNRWKQRP